MFNFLYTVLLVAALVFVISIGGAFISSAQAKTTLPVGDTQVHCMTTEELKTLDANVYTQGYTDGFNFYDTSLLKSLEERCKNYPGYQIEMKFYGYTLRLLCGELKDE